MADRNGSASSATERRRALVNNEAFSDVTFYIGEDEEPIHAHKVILVGASEYFSKELMSDPKKNDPQCRIVLSDVDPSAFRSVLDYFYCGEIGLTMENFRAIFLLAKRFLVTELRTAVEQFLVGRMTAETVLDTLVQNEFFQFQSLEERCLQQISRNPLWYFKQDGFVKISRYAMLLIIKRQAINCSDAQLLDAVKKWGASNTAESTEEMKRIIQKTLRIPDCRLCRVFGPAIKTTSFSVNTLTAAEPMTWYGLGLYMKTSSKSVRVSYSIESLRIGRLPTVTHEYEGNQYGSVNVFNLFFESIKLWPDELYTIQVCSEPGAEMLEVSRGQTFNEKVYFVDNDDSQESRSIPFAYVLVA